MAAAAIVLALALYACAPAAGTGACAPLPPPAAGIDRERMRPELQPTIVAVNSAPEYFAEGYFTEAGGPWRYVINLVERPGMDDVRCQIQALLPVGAPVEWRVVKYSQTELNRIKDELRTVVPSDGSVHAIGPNTITNRVEVRASRADPALEQRLSALYGDAVVVVIEPAPEPI